ncbi:MAG: hypothetical protein ABL986_15225 [Vicinamibacterales bacterium]
MANTTNFNDVMSNELADAKEVVTETAREATLSLTDRLDQTRDTAATGLGKAASALRSAADRIPAKPLASTAHTTANSLDSAADYVRSRDASGMMSDVHGMVKRNPGSALVIAAAFGFVVAKLFTSND